ncbi:MAG TPA: NAD(P)-dependent oxidoreductase [Candidatus Limnocylindria bacterium]|nr:NAD(P)-dependent oxidoreductase [Candidatus Limnocylindria bacterium]
MSTGERVGVVGLGNIGRAIAANLVADGYHVSVYDLDQNRVQSLVGAGARAAANAAQVGERSAVTFLSLPTPSAMEAVADEWLAGAARGAILVDLTTNAPVVVERVGARLAAAGRHLLECPLTGGAPGAQARMLVFMVGGEPVVYERVRPLLAKLGRASFHMGGLGLGNVAKLVNSLIAFQATWGTLEVLAVAAKVGIDLRTMIDVIRAGGAGNVFTERMVEGLNQRQRPTQFALGLAAKDAGLFVDLARQAGVPVPVSAQVAQALVAAVAAGLAERDFTDLVEVVERAAGVKLVLAPPRT